MEVLLCAVGLLLLAPLWPLIAGAIKLEDHWITRVGRILRSLRNARAVELERGWLEPRAA